MTPLEPRQRTAAELRAKGFTVTATAKAIGVSRQAIIRWEKRDDYRQLCELMRQAWVSVQWPVAPAGQPSPASSTK